MWCMVDKRLNKLCQCHISSVVFFVERDVVFPIIIIIKMCFFKPTEIRTVPHLLVSCANQWQSGGASSIERHTDKASTCLTTLIDCVSPPNTATLPHHSTHPPCLTTQHIHPVSPLNTSILSDHSTHPPCLTTQHI